MALDDVYRLRLWHRLHGQAVCNVLHFRQTQISAGNQSATLCADWNNQMATYWRARVATTGGAVMEYLECQRIIPYGDVPHIHNWTGTASGSQAGTCTTGTVAEVITLYTNQAGRRRRGRMYMCGGVTANMSGGQWTSTATNATTQFASNMLTRYAVNAGTTGFALGVWSRVIAGPDPPYDPLAFQPVISATVRTTVRNQRRRQLGVGR